MSRANPQPSEGAQVLLTYIAQNINDLTTVSNPSYSANHTPKPSDGMEHLLAQIARTSATLAAGVTGTAPSGANWGSDSSMFPNGTFPTSGIHKEYDADYEYTFVGGTDSGWTRSARAAQE